MIPPPALSLELKSTATALRIRVGLPAPATRVELLFHSRRNEAISCQSEVSPRRPVGARGNRPPPPPGREIWFPVVDLALSTDLEGVARWKAPPSATFVPNGYRQGTRLPCEPESTLAGHLLDPWENAFFVEEGDSATVLSGFCLRKRLPVPSALSRELATEVEPLGGPWTGRVEALAYCGENLVARSGASLPDSAPRQRRRNRPAANVLGPESLRRSLLASARFVQRGMVRAPGRSLDGGLFTFYDHDAGTWRLPQWPWGWGPPIASLLNAARLAGPREAAGFRSAAIRVGECSLRHLCRDPGSPCDGIGTMRWDFSWQHPGAEYLVTGGSDALFLAAWGWLPLYHETGDERFLDAATRLADTSVRLAGHFELVPQDYLPAEQRWTNHTLDESGFGVEGFLSLYRTTRDERYRQAGATYLERHLAKLARPDGLWERAWLHSEKRVQPTNRLTRGQAWAMEGLLAGWELTGHLEYLGRARRMAAILMEHQRSDGAWTTFFDRPESEVGIDEKGTAIWSLWFLRLHQTTREPVHRQTAGRALGWCLRHQDFDPDEPEARGGLPGVQQRSGVIYRDWFKLSCTYASGFLGLAAQAWLDYDRIPPTRYIS